MIWFVAAIAFIIFQIQNHWPVQGLHPISFPELQRMKNKGAKLVDIREAADYYIDHVDGSVSIYVGRLPFVWHREIAKGDHVVLIGDNRKSIHKATRILRKYAGFTEGALFYIPKKGKAPLDPKLS